jgi:hypothetical protein
MRRGQAGLVIPARLSLLAREESRIRKGEEAGFLAAATRE